MKFPDKVKLKVIAGDGGDGCSSGRREKFMPHGGPDGGDGGKGGSVFFVGDEGASSLLKLHYQKQVKAKRGEHGKGSQQYGQDADDVFVNVPLGTIVKDLKDGSVLGVINENGQKLLVARGGQGGWGNIHFKTNLRQFPNFAMLGEPGEKKELELELQLIGDVTLIGYPSVGKSSIINVLSNTNVKVAEYSFTTLIPNLGVVKHLDKDFVLVDIPGLIEGASDGRGLGNKFLRHILKSKIWTFVLDISRFEDSFKELEILKNELEKFLTNKISSQFPDIFEDEKKLEIEYKYCDKNIQIVLKYEDKILFSKFIMFLVNKIDLVQDEEIVEEFKNLLTNKINEIFGVSKFQMFLVNAGNSKLFENYLNNLVVLLNKDLNQDTMQDTMFDEYLLPKRDFVDKKEENYVKDITSEEIDSLIEDGYISEEKGQIVKVFEVFNRKLAYYTYILPWGNKEAEMHFFDVMYSEKIGILLQDSGVMIGDIIKVKSPYSGIADRYIQRER